MTDAFANSGNLSPTSSETGTWEYHGVVAERFYYTYTFTAPTVTGNTDMVIRFFQIDNVDETTGGDNLSLLLPGGLPPYVNYYDSSGRRLLAKILDPSVFPTDGSPKVSTIAAQTTDINTAIASIPFSIGDLQITAKDLSLSVSSSNTTLIPNGNIFLSSAGSDRVLNIIPASGQVGSANVTVTVNDGTKNTTKTFVVNVGSSLSIGDVSVNEENSGTTPANFAVILDKPSSQDITVSYATSPVGNTVANVDYTTTTNTLTIPHGQTSGTISVPVIGNTKYQTNRNFNVTLSNAVNASIAKATGTGTIVDDDSMPTVTFASASETISKGTSVTVGLQLSAASGMDTIIPFTVSGTAASGTDYTGLTTSPMTISAGNTSGNITMNSSSTAGNGKTIILTLGIPTYATLGNQSAHTLTISTPIIPKTGQTTSYAVGDDGALQKGVAWPDPRFTDNGNGTITDNLTGLIWLKNANCFGTQTWTNALASANALASGSCGLTDGSETGAWRLPNLRELRSLSDYGYSQLIVRPDLPFTGMQPDFYWSSTTSDNDTSSAFYGFIEGGSGYYRPKTNAYQVLPVKGESISALTPVPMSGQTISYGPRDDGAMQEGIPWHASRFHDQGDGTIHDALTGLIWMKNADCFGNMDWYGASTQASDFNNGLTTCSGYVGTDTDWRLPSINELESLIDFGHSNPSLPTDHPFTGVQNNYYWSSTTGAAYPTSAVWHIDFRYGSIVTYTKSGFGYVWLVRGGQ
ncbi:MAG: DUF1566 domain-containing protein [Magnetococcales bacterium]|nr:DUF1566 domain-containing protein [Magnetococcales bacterium]